MGKLGNFPSSCKRIFYLFTQKWILRMLTLSSWSHDSMKTFKHWSRINTVPEELGVRSVSYSPLPPLPPPLPFFSLPSLFPVFFSFSPLLFLHLFFFSSICSWNICVLLLLGDNPADGTQVETEGSLAWKTASRVFSLAVARHMRSYVDFSTGGIVLLQSFQFESPLYL